MGSAKTLFGVAVIASLVTLAVWTALAETGTTAAAPSTGGQLGPPLPLPGQPSLIPWQQRLAWLQQQLAVLGHDPGPNQDLFGQLARQVDAIMAAAPGMTPQETTSWPLTRLYPATQPFSVISPSAQQQGLSPGGAAQQQTGGTGQQQAMATGQPASAGMGTGGTTGPAQAPPQGQPPGPPPPQPPRPPAGPEGPRSAIPPGPPPPPMNEAERQVQGAVHMARELERTVTSPLQVTILAVQGITDAAKDNPQAGIDALQALLEQEQAVPVRTVIHFTLKDLYLKAGQMDAATQQLQAVVRENSRLISEAEQRMSRPGLPPRLPRPTPPPPAEPER